MSDILSEEKADEEVLKSLLRQALKVLNERNQMSNSKLLFDINGDLYRATAFEKLNEEDLNRELAEAQEEVSSVQEAIDFSNKLQNPVATPEAPAPAVEEPTTPVVETPAPVEQAQPQVPTYPDVTLGVPTPVETPAAEPTNETATVSPVVLS